MSILLAFVPDGPLDRSCRMGTGAEGEAVSSEARKTSDLPSKHLSFRQSRSEGLRLPHRRDLWGSDLLRSPQTNPLCMACSPSMLYCSPFRPSMLAMVTGQGIRTTRPLSRKSCRSSDPLFRRHR